MRVLNWAGGVFLSVAGAAVAQTGDGVSDFTLDNGLHVVVIEDHRAPVVVQMVWYKIGAADEAPGKSGIAHYLEHLMFKGTDKLAPGELSKRVSMNGGMDNAFTSYDYTAYFQRIAADRLPLVMEMEADRMAHLRIGPEDWQAERQVVLEERAQRTESDPVALLGEEQAATQFYNHPYGRPIIGWRHEMESLTREDALDWYKTHYAPDQAVLIVAGDVTPERVRELADATYGQIPAAGQAAPRIRPQEPPQAAPRRIERHDPRVAEPVMTRTILAPQRKTGAQKEAAALTVLAGMLGGNPQTSVLGRALMQTGQAIYAGASYDGLSLDPTVFTLTLVPRAGQSPAKAEADFDAVLAKFLADGPDPAQLERIKTQIRAAEIYAKDSAHGRAYDYGQALTTGLTIQDVRDWPDVLASVTVDDVKSAARILQSSQAVTGWLLPDRQSTTDQAAPSEHAPRADDAQTQTTGKDTP